MRAPARPAAQDRPALRRGAGALGAAAAAALLAGCAQAAAVSAAPIQIGPAYVTEPGQARSTNAFMTIQNDTRHADRLISASTSVGGRVELFGPPPAGGAMRGVADIPIPAGDTVRLRPNSYHLILIDPGRMVSGRQITMKLVFARAGLVRVAVTVTDPENGGGSYFLN